MASFEEEYKELQQIVEQMESSDVGLEQSVTKFKHGVTLLKSLRSQLQKTENELKTIDLDIAKEPLEQNNKA